MTQEELLAKIKAEIERRIKECEATYPKDKGGYWFPEQEGAYAIAEEYKQLLSFISTLESEKPVPNDLEEAAWDCVLDSVDVNNPVLLPKYKELLTYLFIDGAKWQKEQMMKEAVEGEITKDNRGNNVVRTGVFNNGFEIGDKVRIIIVKE